MTNPSTSNNASVHKQKRLKTTAAGAFQSAGSMMKSGVEADEKDDENFHDFSMTNAAAGGFRSAALLVAKTPSKGVDDDKDERLTTATNISQTRNTTTLVTPGDNAVKSAPREISLNLKIRGVVHYLPLPEILLSLSRDSKCLVFLREPTNEYDTNAIQALLATQRDDKSIIVDLQNGTSRMLDSAPVKIGYVAKEQAEILAPLMDEGLLCVKAVDVVRGFRTVLGSRATFNTTISNASENYLKAQHHLGGKIVNSMKHLHQRDLEESQSCPYTMEELGPPLPWNPITPLPSHWEQGRKGKTVPPIKVELNLEYGWTLGNQPIPPISHEERKVAMATLWPPSDVILAKLGMGGASDAGWWKKYGLLPPVDWNVHGPFDLLDSTDKKSLTRRPVSLWSRTQVQCAASVLDGAIHGVTNVWCKETLQDIRGLMHSQNFWLFRKNEAYIRAFGGPYILGQKADSLDLVNGQSHNTLTAMICVAQNLVYTAVHLETPPAPGFNTIIFGLNMNASGFHYHQDCISELEGKNAPLIPKQPVVTTVFYEQEDDSGKECVFWKPMLNFTPETSNESATKKDEGVSNNPAYEKLYLAARALVTTHGMMHVQRAGLQKHAQHGIFHTPQSAVRTGYRTAITARITHRGTAAAESLQPFLEQGVYKGVLGPGGNLTLPAPSNNHSDLYHQTG